MTRALLIADRIATPRGIIGDAVLVDRGTIRATGKAARLRSEGLEEIEYPGATIVPGLVDAHLHPIGYAASLARPILKGARDFDDLADILAGAARSQPPESAIVALRLDDESLAEERLPDRGFLDRVVPDRPVLMVRYCGHVAVANTAALEYAGITRNTTDPPRGTIDRDTDGRPTGVLRETAIDPVSSALQDVAPPVTRDDLVLAAHALASVGLTRVGAVVDLDAGCWAGAGSELDLLLSAADDLPIDMEILVVAKTPADLADAASRIDTVGGSIHFAGLKMFSDGSIGGHTAAMHTGFSDVPGESGTDRLDPRWAAAMARAALAMGSRVAVHAIGDRANENVLDLMGSLIEEGADPSLLRIEHASVLTERDIDRFGALGVTASVQPAFIASETGWLEKRLGAERVRRTYPFRSLAGAGAPLAGGSDSPVEPPHPLWGMAAARDRCGFVPEEGLDAGAALAMFTGGGAAAIGRRAGLEDGEEASLTVLPVDPLAADPAALRDAEVVATWVRGSQVAVPEGMTTWKG